MTRTRPLLLLLVAVVVGGVVVLGGRANVAGTPVAGTTTTTTTTTFSPSTTTLSPATTTTPASAPLAGRIKPGERRQGVATFYDSDGGGACSYDPGPDPLTAAMNADDYENSAACGAHVLVEAADGKSITVRVTNLCPAPCRPGQLDLSAEAFALLAAPVRGEIPVTWTLVSPPAAKPIGLRYKTGSSRYWCGIQVLDHRNPVARLEVRAGEQWRPLPRAEYNYFLSENGAGCGGDIAITDVHGERLVVPAPPVRPDVVQTTNVQFTAR